MHIRLCDQQCCTSNKAGHHQCKTTPLLAGAGADRTMLAASAGLSLCPWLSSGNGQAHCAAAALGILPMPHHSAAGCPQLQGEKISNSRLSSPSLSPPGMLSGSGLPCTNHTLIKA